VESVVNPKSARMKTRFLTALTHELPGADFRTATGEPRIRRPLRLPAPCQSTAPPRHRPSDARTGSHENLPESDWWRFASEWRRKPADNFIPTPERKKLFRCLGAGVSALLLLVVAGCKTDSWPAPAAENHAAFTSSTNFADVSSLQMVTVTNQLDPALLRAPTNLFTLGPGDKLDIELPDETNSLSTTVVGPDGKIYFSLL